MLSPITALVLSVAVLAIGPALATVLERRASLRAVLDGFVLVMVGGLSLLFLLPHAYQAIGMWAFPVGFVGLLIPSFAEWSLRSSRAGASRIVLGLAVLGLAFHGALDGAALALPELDAHGHGHGHGHDHGHGQLDLTLAILAHRLPVGLFTWAVLTPLVGRRWALGAIGLLMLSTVVGFAASAELVHHGADDGHSHGLFPALVEALLAGGLLHVVVDHVPSCEDAEHHPRSAGVGAIAALALFAILPLEANEALHQSGDALVRLFMESSPAILLGFLGAGLLSLVSRRTLERLMRGRNALDSTVRGIVFGLPLPICSCGVVPIYRELMKSGIPPAAAMAFLIATPELGIDAVAISIPLLGVELTVLRVLAAAVLALVAGLAIAAFTRDESPSAEADLTGAAEPAVERAPGPLKRALRHAFVDSLDELGPWIVAGLAVAALLDPLFDPSWASLAPGPMQVPIFAALGAPFYVCASAATPVGAAFLAKGISAGAVVAFLLMGPATNVTTYGAVRASHGRRTTWLVLGTILAVTCVAGLVIDGVAGTRVLGAEGVHEHAPGPLAVACTALFVVLLLASVLRQGPRGFLRRLGVRGHGHDHDHGHSHGETSGDGENSSETCSHDGSDGVRSP